ncbi:hypothetical protein FKB34_03695 [Glycocaulis profundi]|nr:hypothetical protein FKB34_03695 [Glycocaulis profundi]
MGGSEDGMTQAVVVGAGLKGIAAARALALEGCQTILVDPAPRLGGVYATIPWEGFSLDIGRHIFPGGVPATAVLQDLAGAPFREVRPRAASISFGCRTLDSELPDFTHLDDDARGALLADVLDHAVRAGPEAAAPPCPHLTMAAQLEHRFGARAAAALAPMAAKILQADPAEISGLGLLPAPFTRLRLADDETTAALKRVPAFDRVLQQINLTGSPSSDPAPARHLYPASGGMGGFASACAKRLEELGVALELGRTVRALSPGARGGHLVLLDDGRSLSPDIVVWTSGAPALAGLMGLDPAPIEAEARPAPIVLYYFDIPAQAATGLNWVWDFDPDHLAFRISVPSLIDPANAPDGRHYVCAEVPVPLDGPVFADPAAHAQTVWAEVHAAGIAAGPMPERFRTMKTPVAYRSCTPAWREALVPLQERLARHEGLEMTDEFLFGAAPSVQEAARAVSTALDGPSAARLAG